MTHFPVLTMESAPQRSKPALKQMEAAFGMIPNIAGVVANSPVLINSLVGVFGNVHGGSFTEPQIQTVLLRTRKADIRGWPSRRHGRACPTAVRFTSSASLVGVAGNRSVVWGCSCGGERRPFDASDWRARVEQVRESRAFLE